LGGTKLDLVFCFNKFLDEWSRDATSCFFGVLGNTFLDHLSPGWVGGGGWLAIGFRAS